MKMNHISDGATLHNGVKIPWIGLGTYLSEDGEQVKNAIHYAVNAGYRHIDTAALYHNEVGVGNAVKSAGVPREELFVTTKVWNADQGIEPTLKAFDDSMKKLDIDYIDLYLIHWPGKEGYKETWKALEKIYEEGKVKAIGVSNFMVSQLENLLQDCKIVPMVNQVEFHPYLVQPELIEFCNANKIVMEAWSPLMQGKVLQVKELAELAEKYGKSIVQIVLRWSLQKGVVTIPKSVKEERIIANAQIFDFEISEEDIAKIDALDKGERLGFDPLEFDFQS